MDTVQPACPIPFGRELSGGKLEPTGRMSGSPAGKLTPTGQGKPRWGDCTGSPEYGFLWKIYTMLVHLRLSMPNQSDLMQQGAGQEAMVSAAIS